MIPLGNCQRQLEFLNQEKGLNLLYLHINDSKLTLEWRYPNKYKNGVVMHIIELIIAYSRNEIHVIPNSLKKIIIKLTEKLSFDIFRESLGG